MEKCTNKCLQLSFFRLITHLNKRIRFCLIFARNNWDLASVGCKGRSPCKRELTSSASKGQGALVIKIVKSPFTSFMVLLLAFFDFVNDTVFKIITIH